MFSVKPTTMAKANIKFYLSTIQKKNKNLDIYIY